VGLFRTDVSEERLLFTANCDPISPIISALNMVATSTSETSAPTRPIRRQILEDGILQWKVASN
jgi:hypothetical protein